MRFTMAFGAGWRIWSVWRRCGSIAVVAFTLSAVIPASALALTRRQADAIAIRTLAPQRRPSSVALFGLPAPLNAGQRIESYSLSSSARLRLPELRLHGRAWLFWEDLAYEAQFAHPSVLLVIDDRTGRVLERSNIDMYPLIDGRMPRFVTPSGYRSPKLIVYSTMPVGAVRTPQATRASLGAGLKPAFRKPTAHAAQDIGPISRDDLLGECLVTIGDRGPTESGNNLGDADLAKNLTAMDDWAQSVGLKHYDAGSSGPDLRLTVYRAVTQHDCSDVLIYISGHGTPPPPDADHPLHLGKYKVTFPSGKAPAGGPPQIQLKANSTSGIGGASVTGVFLTPESVGDTISTIVDGGDFRSDKSLITVKAHPDVRFKVKIDSCYSQRFADVLSTKFGISTANSANPKSPITILEYSSSSSEPSLLYLPEWEDNGTVVKNPTDNTGQISEFTNGNIRGLDSWTKNPDPTKPRDITAGLTQAFTAGAGQDWARTLGLTNPGAIGPGGLSLGTPDTLTPKDMNAGLIPINVKTSGIPPPIPSVTATVTGPAAPDCSLQLQWTVGFEKNATEYDGLQVTLVVSGPGAPGALTQTVTNGSAIFSATEPSSDTGWTAAGNVCEGGDQSKTWTGAVTKIGSYTVH